MVGRHTFSGWVSALHVAAARLDETRLARYRSTFAAVWNVAALQPGSMQQLLYLTFAERDPRAALDYLELSPTRASQPDRKAEVISALLFEFGETVPEATLAAIESEARSRLAALLLLRIRLARAVVAGESPRRHCGAGRGWARGRRSACGDAPRFAHARSCRSLGCSAAAVAAGRSSLSATARRAILVCCLDSSGCEQSGRTPRFGQRHAGGARRSRREGRQFPQARP